MKFKTMEWCRTRARSDKNYGNQGRVRDEFKFVKRLGQGNMGTVFMVVHSGSQKIFAMKVMNKEVLRSRNASKMAATEKEILSSLDHPFLPSLLTHFESENHTFLAMKYCSGGDINVLRHKQPNKIFSEATIRFYAAEVVMALEYLHEHGIVYRDLKPENILVQDNGHIMLTDFNLSLRLPSRCKERDLQGDGNCDSFVGTEEYVAPEVLWGRPHAFAVDWWSFGVLLYEMSSGKTPFRGSNRKETFFNILCKDPPFDAGSIFCSSALKDLIQRLLVKDPSKRLRSASHVKNHAFFYGLRWNELEFVCRPPFVPSSTHIDELSVHGPDATGNSAYTVGSETDRSQEVRGLYCSVTDRNFPDCKARSRHNNIKKEIYNSDLLFVSGRVQNLFERRCSRICSKW